MERTKVDVQSALEELSRNGREAAKMRKTTGEGLDLDYCVLLPRVLADEIFRELERIVEYYDGALTKVRVFGKWHEIPRQQVAFGDEGMKYKFSGTEVPAKPWFPLLEHMKSLVEAVTGCHYNFVLINRYRNGTDHMGEHRDDEKELDRDTPIASLSLGQKRTFVLKHTDLRKKKRKDILPVKFELEHGSLLLMNYPTNELWYHSLPPRKTANGIRINLTFRNIVLSKNVLGKYGGSASTI